MSKDVLSKPSSYFTYDKQLINRKKRIETIHALYKQRRSLQTDSAFSMYHELQKLPVAS